MKATALTGLSPRDCLERVNRSLAKESVAEMFVTMFYGILDTRTGEVRYSSGGHNPAYIIRADGKVEPAERTEGIVLGAMEKSRYKEKEFELKTGDAVVLYTDGVTEAMNHKNEEFTEERLISCLEKLTNKPAMQTVSRVLEAVNAFTAGAPQSDDVTILVVRCTR